jgi:hypothetical protein
MGGFFIRQLSKSKQGRREMKAYIAAILISLCCIPAMADIDSAPLNSMRGADWYGIYMEDNKIGYAAMIFDKGDLNTWNYSTSIFLQLEMNQAVATITSIDKRNYSGTDGQLIANTYESNSGMGVIKGKGNLKDDQYEVEIDIMGQITSKSFTPPVESLDDLLAVQLKARQGNLKPGETFSQKIFVPDPSILDTMTHIIRFTGERESRLGAVDSRVYTFRDSIPALRAAGNSYLDESGRIIMQDFPAMGMVMKLEPEAMAKSLEAGFDVLKDGIIKVANGPVQSKNVDYAEYIISGFAIEQLPESSRLQVTEYALDSARIIINKDKLDNFDLKLPVVDSELRPYLQPEPLIQSDNEEIKKLAKDIIGSETNACQAARLINQWVYSNIRKEFSPDISNAYQTLKTGRGDCGEHTALTIALLRAIGIPARGLGGIAYLPTVGGFGYHAWVEVYVGRWLQIDPTWGEDNADATHIALARGNLKDQLIGIMGLMKKLRVEISDYH